MKSNLCAIGVLLLAAIPLIVASSGRGGSTDDGAPKVETPAQAGSQLDQAFQNASGAAKDNAARDPATPGAH